MTSGGSFFAKRRVKLKCEGRERWRDNTRLCSRLVELLLCNGRNARNSLNLWKVLYRKLWNLLEFVRFLKLKLTVFEILNLNLCFLEFSLIIFSKIRNLHIKLIFKFKKLILTNFQKNNQKFQKFNDFFLNNWKFA